MYFHGIYQAHVEKLRLQARKAFLDFAQTTSRSFASSFRRP